VDEEEVKKIVQEALSKGTHLSQQPQALATISTNILVFSGLLVAGSLSFVASANFAGTGLLTKITIIALLAVSLGAGVLAIISNLYAHNLGRYLEWDGTQITTWQSKKKGREGKSPVDKARGDAVDSAEYAHYFAIGAAVIVIILTAFVLFEVDEPPSALGFSVVEEDGVKAVLVDGSTKKLRLIETDEGCQYEVETRAGVFSINLEDPCTVQD